MASSLDLRAALNAAPANVIQDVHPADPMKSVSEYSRMGLAALRCIRVARLAGNAKEPEAILDLGSGYGRVMRFLKAEYPNAELTACDLRLPAVQFCAKAFGARPVLGSENPDVINLPVAHFDLLWCGSLLTHVDEGEWLSFLRLFDRVLRPSGIAVFTTLGRLVTEKRVRAKQSPLMLKDEQIPSILEGYDTKGFGFAETLSLGKKAFRTAYGATLVSPAWVSNTMAAEMPDLQLLVYTEGGWGPRNGWGQDCVAVQKAT